MTSCSVPSATGLRACPAAPPRATSCAHAGWASTVVKFFPAEAVGGLDMLKAIAAPFPGLRFVPTGGIDPDNMAVYLADSRVAGGGRLLDGQAGARARPRLGDRVGIGARGGRCRPAPAGGLSTMVGSRGHA